jgi:molecular chaperone DnaJ
MKIFIQSNMLIIQTDLSILNKEWFGRFIIEHGTDMIFLPISVIVFFNENKVQKRKKFLSKLAEHYAEQTEFYQEQLMRNFIRYKHKPIKIEFDKDEVEKLKGREVKVKLDAISNEKIQLKLEKPNKWVISFFLAQLDSFLLKWNSKIIQIDVSESRTKARIDRMLKKDKFLFFKIKYIYNEHFLYNLFNPFSSGEKEYDSFTSNSYQQDAQMTHWYSVLEAPYGASIGVVKQNYRKLAKMYHPDRVHNKNKTIVELYTKRFQEIQNAYASLKQRLK